MRPRIFISHAHQDEHLAALLASRLRARNYAPWIYEEHQEAVNYLELLKRAIEESAAFVLLATPASIATNQVDKEFEGAHETCNMKKLPIIPVLVGLTRNEMVNRKPGWAHAIGAIICIETVGDEAADRVLATLVDLGIKPPPSPTGKGNDSTTPRVIAVEARVPPVPIFGRDPDLRKALKKIRERSFAITGISGIGKSKVVSAVVERLATEKDPPFQKIYFRRFTGAQPPTFSEFSRRFVTDFKGPDADLSGTGTNEQVQMVARILDDCACLLVIDQFESAIEPDTLVPKESGFANLLALANQGLPKSRVLVTSWEVPKDSAGLDFPHMLLGPLDEMSSRRLLDSRLEKSPSQPRRDDLLTELSRRLRGHPYSMELMASGHTVEELKALLYKENVLWEGKRALVSSKVASQAVSRLSRALRNILDAICIFLKPSPVEAIAAVAGISKEAAFEGVCELRKRSLISHREGDIYDCQDLVREHVTGNMEAGKAERLNVAAAEYYLSLPRPLPEKRSNISDMQTLIDAAAYFLRASRHDQAARLLLDEGIARSAFSWGALPELKDLLEKVEARALGADGSHILSYHGLALRDLGEYSKAEVRYLEGLEISRECRDPLTQCLQLVNLGDANYYLGNYKKAIEYHGRAMAFISEGGIPRDLEARNCGCLGNAELSLGNLKGAEKLYERAASICGEIGEKRYSGIWLGDLGNLYEQRGEKERAVALYDKAFAFAREVNDRRHESWWLGVLGNALALGGDKAGGRRNLEKALEMSERIGFRRGILYQTKCLAMLADSASEIDAVIEPLRRVVRDSDRMKEPVAAWTHRIILGRHLFAKAFAALEDGKTEPAINLGLEALACLPDSRAGYVLLGSAYRRVKKARRTREILNKGIECFTRAIEISPDASLYDSRAALHYYSKALEKALAGYVDALRLSPAASGTAISKAETELALGRFQQARKTCADLDPDLLTPPETAIALCWDIMAHELDGLPAPDKLSLLEGMDVVISTETYDPTDIEPHLKRLYRSGISPDRIEKADRAYRVLLSKYGDLNRATGGDTAL